MRVVTALVGVVAAAAVALLVLAIQASPRGGITAQQADEILTELRTMRQTLDRVAGQPGDTAPARLPAPSRPDPKVKLASVGAFAIGRADAPITLVEFTDLQCPYCSRFAATTYPEIKKALIDTGKVRFITRDFPLAFHREAMRAARACRCAADQKKFWEMRETLSRNAARLSPEFMVSAARTLGMDTAAFGICLDSTRYTADVERDLQEGAALGITGTPAFVLGRSTGSQLSGVRIVGALPFAAFDDRVKALLAPTPPAAGDR